MYIDPSNNIEAIKAIGLTVSNTIDIKINTIILVRICKAGVIIDSAKLTDTCIIFFERYAISFLTKYSYD